MDKLFVVTDVVVVPGKGLVMLPALHDEPHGLDVGSKLELVRPDGVRFTTCVVSLDYVNGGIRICIPFEPPLCPGTEVWLRQEESGIIFRATAESATHAVHRPRVVAPLRAVPGGMLLAGGSGRRR